MLEGDDALIYHTGNEKSLIGFARIASAPYPDPSQKDPRLVVVDIEAGKALPRQVSLAEIKADPAFQNLGLVRLSRLSVVPVEPDQWKRLLAMAGV
jgi:predicted RNA-binding protein with PUA-like domain